MDELHYINALSEEELLENFLPRDSVKQLLREYRSIYQMILHVPDTEKNVLSGSDRKKFKQIQCIRELMKRIEEERRQEIQVIRGPEDVLGYFRFLEDRKQEEFWILLLNAKNKIIKSQRITIGTLMASLVAPREAYYPAIQFMAAGIIAIHNHPSGDSTASKEDLAVTERLIKSGKILDIPLIDHVIVGRDGGSSIKLKNEYLWNK